MTLICLMRVVVVYRIGLMVVVDITVVLGFEPHARPTASLPAWLAGRTDGRTVGRFGSVWCRRCGRRFLQPVGAITYRQRLEDHWPEKLFETNAAERSVADVSE